MNINGKVVGFTAEEISYDNTTSGLAADEVQTAIDLLNIGGGGGLATHLSDFTNPHQVTKTQVGLSNVLNTLNNYTAIVVPTSNDDNTLGYSIGSIWTDTVLNKSYIATEVGTGVADWRQISDGSVSPVTESGQFLYFNKSVSSDIGTYFELGTDLTGTGQILTPYTLNAVAGTPLLLDSFVTPSGYPNSTAIPQGLSNLKMYASVLSTAGTTTISYEVYKRVLAGTETLLFSSDESLDINSVSTSTPQIIDLDLAILNTVILSTDRLVIKIYGTKTTPGDQTLTINYEGNSFYTRYQSTFTGLEAYTKGAPTPVIDEAIALFDGITGKLIKQAPVKISTAGNVSYTTTTAKEISNNGDMKIQGVNTTIVGATTLVLNAPAITPVNITTDLGVTGTRFRDLYLNNDINLQDSGNVVNSGVMTVQATTLTLDSTGGIIKAGSDNTTDFGTPSTRFKTLYSTDGLYIDRSGLAGAGNTTVDNYCTSGQSAQYFATNFFGNYGFGVSSNSHGTYNSQFCMSKSAGGTTPAVVLGDNNFYRYDGSTTHITGDLTLSGKVSGNLVTGNVIPDIDDTYSLGSPLTKQYQSINLTTSVVIANPDTTRSILSSGSLYFTDITAGTDGDIVYTDTGFVYDTSNIAATHVFKVGASQIMALQQDLVQFNQPVIADSGSAFFMNGDGVDPANKTGYSHIYMDSNRNLIYKWNSIPYSVAGPTAKSYGQLFLSNNATATTFVSAGVFYPTLGSFQSGPLNDFTRTLGRLTYTGALTKTFVVTSSIDIKSASASVTNYVFHLYKNGSGAGLSGSQTQSTTTDTTTRQSATTRYIVSLATNDYMEMYSFNGSNTQALTVNDMSFNIVEV